MDYVRKLADQTERTFPDVTEYLLSKDGKSLTYAVASAKEDTDGAYVVATAGTIVRPSRRVGPPAKIWTMPAANPISVPICHAAS